MNNIKIVEAATGNNYNIGIGFLPDNTPVVVAKTPLGEGYTKYPTLIHAGRIFDEIVELKDLTIIK